MKRVAALVFAASPALAVDVPSGQPIELQEVPVEQQDAEQWVRFRFVAPGIAREDGGVSYADAMPDFMYLCASLATPYLAEYALSADVVVISLADRETEFGVADPEATQFFEAFSLEGGGCEWGDI